MICLNWLVAVATALAPVGTSPTSLHVVDLGTLAGGYSHARAINDRGEVVGVSAVEDSVHAFLWRDGRMTDLGTLGGRFSVASDINDRGEVVGYSSTANGALHAFLWRDGHMTDLGTVGPQDSASAATGINDRGDIVGQTDGPDNLHAFRWRRGQMTLIDSGPSIAYGINNRGDVVGTSFADGIATATLWRDGRAIAVGQGDALAINDRGQIIVGAGLWRDGHVTPIDPPAHAVYVQGTGLNNHGAVVGFSDVGAFLWRQGHAITLPALAPEINSAVDINDRGQIVGMSGSAEGKLRAVLWTR
ncbi:MAG TPA: hypothetical protein VF062_26050 [Candidatus Limnocylindrales bacterium]